MKLIGKRGLAIATGLMLLAVPSTRAQESGEGVEDESTAFEGFVLGQGLLRPSFEALIEHDDNIFLTKVNKVDDIIWVLRPKIEYEVPFRQSSFRVGALLQYKDFQDYEFDENLSPLGSFDLLLRFANGMTFTIGDRYISGVLEVDEIDPGKEVVFGSERFRKNTITAGLRYDWDTRNGIGFMASIDDLTFDERTDIFYDYQNVSVGASYFHKLNPLTEIQVQANFLESSHDDAFAFRDATGAELWVGIRGEIAKTLSGTIRGGYRSLDYDDNVLSDEGYSSPVLQVSVDKAFGEDAALTFLAERSSFQTNYSADVNYYTSTKGGLEYNQKIDRLFFQLGGVYQANDYADPGLTGTRSRDDRILTGRVSLGYYFMRTLSLRANYRYDDRDSNQDEFDYTTNAYVLDLRWGY
jgi:hypothetical protein